MNVGKETKAFWGDKFIEILDPHKEGHIVRVYPDYWNEKAPDKRWVSLTEEDLNPICDEWRIIYGGWVDNFAKEIESKLKEKNCE